MVIKRTCNDNALLMEDGNDNDFDPCKYDNEFNDMFDKMKTGKKFVKCEGATNDDEAVLLFTFMKLHGVPTNKLLEPFDCVKSMNVCPPN